MASFLIVILTSACGEEESARVPDISGTWVSVMPEAGSQGEFVERTFSFNDRSWSLTVVVGFTPTLSAPVFKYEAEGMFEIQGSHATISNAFNADFSFTTRFLTVFVSDPALLSALGFASCGLTTGQRTDISANGCSFYPSIQACPKELDLIQHDGDMLFLGDRLTNLCETRATRPGLPLAKK